MKYRISGLRPHLLDQNPHLTKIPADSFAYSSWQSTDPDYRFSTDRYTLESPVEHLKNIYIWAQCQTYWIKVPKSRAQVS